MSRSRKNSNASGKELIPAATAIGDGDDEKKRQRNNDNHGNINNESLTKNQNQRLESTKHDDDIDSTIKGSLRSDIAQLQKSLEYQQLRVKGLELLQKYGEGVITVSAIQTENLAKMKESELIEKKKKLERLINERKSFLLENEKKLEIIKQRWKKTVTKNAELRRALDEMGKEREHQNGSSSN